MILSNSDAASLYEVEGTLDSSEAVQGLSIDSVIVSKWRLLLTEHFDVFEVPDKPVARAVDHRINLIDPTVVPPCLWLYKILDDKPIAIKYNISDYIDKGWIRQVLVYMGLQF